MNWCVLNDETAVRVAFQGTRRWKYKTRNRINCCSFFFALSKKFVHRGCFWLFFVKCLFFCKISTIKESVLIEWWGSKRWKYLRRNSKSYNQGPFLSRLGLSCDLSSSHWFKRAKFGIFIHWGLYSLPAFGSEWYSRKCISMVRQNLTTISKTYGLTKISAMILSYPFTAENFHADELRL